MKTLVMAVLLGVASMSSISTKAQINLSINIGQQPAWGPTGYDHVEYYYLPDVNAYYYVPSGQYIYLLNGSWVWRSSLPARYSGYDLYNGYKVVMNTPKPYLSYNTHVKQYAKYKGGRSKQALIRDSRDTKYVNARNSKPAQNAKPVQNNRSTQNRVGTPANNNKTKAAPSKQVKGNVGNGKNNGKGNERGRNGRG